MFEKNSFIKWSSSDDEGSFSIIGEVIEVTDEFIKFIDNEGIVYGIPKDDGQFTINKKPKNWKNNIVNIETIIPKTIPTKTKRTRSSNGVTQLDRVVELLRNNSTLITNRKKAMDEIVKQLGMSLAGASTYFSNAKKQLT